VQCLVLGANSEAADTRPACRHTGGLSKEDLAYDVAARELVYEAKGGAADRLKSRQELEDQAVQRAQRAEAAQKRRARVRACLACVCVCVVGGGGGSLVRLLQGPGEAVERAQDG
jgi:hypothetical protein